METLYFSLCKILGGAEVLLALRMYRGGLKEYRLTFFAFLLVDAASNLIPAELWNPAWWRFVWAPLAIWRLGLMAIESFEIGRVSAALPRRDLAPAYAALGTVLLLGAAWTWHPQNRFQSFDVVNQYARFAIFTSFTIFWSWQYLRNGLWALLTVKVRFHALLWIAWLATAFATSTKAKAGLLWLFAPWKGNYALWLMVGCQCAAVQLLLVRWFFRNERS